MTNIRKGNIITFTYTNWKGEVGERKAIVSELSYGSNEYHKEEQFILLAFDLDKMEYRTFTLKDMSNVEVIEVKGI